MEWKWTKGEPYERSRRQSNANANNMYDTNTAIITNKEVESSAYSSSLNYDENNCDI